MFTDRVQNNSNQELHPLRGEHRRRQHLERNVQKLRESHPVFRTASLTDILQAFVRQARRNSIADTSRGQYAVGQRRFEAFLRIKQLTLPDVLNLGPGHFWNNLMCQYATYLFAFEHLQTTTITNYFAGLQHQLVTADAQQTVCHNHYTKQLRSYSDTNQSIYP